MIDNVLSKICIIGAGGFGKEVLSCLDDYFGKNQSKLSSSSCFMVEDNYYEVESIFGIPVLKISDFDPSKYSVVVSISDVNVRKRIVENLPKNTSFSKIIHPSSVISRWATIGSGSIVTAGVTIGSDSVIENHCHFNPNSTIAHDCKIGNYFTIAPLSSVSGNCFIGNNVYIGTNSSTKQKITICDDVFIGMGAMVTKNITQKGIYIGIPAKIKI